MHEAGTMIGPTGKCDSERIYIILCDHTGILLCGWNRFSHIEKRVSEQLDAMAKHEFLKLGYEMDTDTFEYAKQLSPDFYNVWNSKMKEYFDSGRMSVIGGTYAQAVSALIPEESVIRQFEYGIRTSEQCAGYRPKIYAFSENTGWACLPQILNEFGFEGAIVATHHLPLGHAPTYIASKGLWVGRDGSAIAAIPTYEGDNDVRMHGGMNSGQYIFVYEKEDLIAKLDAYFRAKKEMGIDYVVVHVVEDADIGGIGDTWATLFKEVDPDGRKYRFISAEEAFCTIPFTMKEGEIARFHIQPNQWSLRRNWGYLGDISPIEDRKCEAYLYNTQVMTAFDYILGNRCMEFAELDEAWKKHLLGQTHDGVICAEGLLWAVDMHRSAMKLAEPVLKESAQSIVSRIDTSGGEISIVVFNTLNWDREVFLEAELDYVHDKTIQINRKDTSEVVEYDVLRVHEGKIQISLKVDAPALGHVVHSVRYLDRSCEKQILRYEPLQDNEIVENSYWRITFSKQGEILSLTDKHFDIPILSGNGVHPSHTFTARVFEKADDPTSGCLHMSEGTFAEIARGDLVTIVKAYGLLGTQRYQTLIRVYRDLPEIDFETTFQFDGKTIGHIPKYYADQWGEINENPRFDRLVVNFYPSFQFGEGDPYKPEYPLHKAEDYNRFTNVTRYTPFWVERYKRESSMNTLATESMKYPNHIYNLDSNYWIDISDTDGSRGFVLVNSGTGGHVYDGQRLSMVLARGDHITPLKGYQSKDSLRVDENIGEDGRYTWRYRLLPHLTKEDDVVYDVHGCNFDAHKAGIDFNAPLLFFYEEAHAGDLPARLRYLEVCDEVMLSALVVREEGLFARIYEYRGKHISEPGFGSQLFEFVILPYRMDFKTPKDRDLSVSPYLIRTYKLEITEDGGKNRIVSGNLIK